MLLVIGLMCGGLVTLLLLNTMLAQGSYQEKDLRSSIDELRQQAAAQEAQLRRDGQPGALDEAARRYGMVRDDGPPRFITPRPESPAAEGLGPEGRGR